MRIFTNKIPRSWKSSGVTVKNDQLEMSSFSFLEEYFISNSTKFNITIIGKNVVGNGLCSISIYKDAYLVWQEDLIFGGISFSKKQVQIDGSPADKFKITISRGKRSKGRLVISQVFIYQDVKKEIIEEAILTTDVGSEPEEDEPTFFLEDPPKPLDVPEEEIKIPEVPGKEVLKNVSPKKQKRKAKYVRTNPIVTESSNIISVENKESEATDNTVEVDDIIEVPEKRAIKDIWITVIDFDATTDERDIFNYLNQISFGKEKQTFFVKQSSAEPIDFSKYDHVKVFSDNDSMVEALILEWPKKITSLKGNLNEDLFNKIEEIKNEISK